MQKSVVTEKYLFDSDGRLCGRVVTTEVYDHRGDMELYDPDTYVDVEPEAQVKEAETNGTIS